MHDLSIRVNLGASGSDPQVTYSRPLSAEQESRVRKKVLSIFHQIHSLPSVSAQDPIRQVSFDFNAEKHFASVHTQQGQTLHYAVQDLEGEVRLESEQLIETVNHLGSSTLRSTLASFPSAHEQKNRSTWQRFVRLIQHFFFWHTTVNPIIQRVMHAQLENKNVEELKALYIQSDAAFQELKREIQEKALGIFDEREVDLMIEEKLLAKANQELQKLKKPMLSEKAINQLNVARLFKEVERAGLSQKVAQDLHRLPPLDMSIDVLAQIPLHSSNQVQLKEIWRQLLVNLSVEGRLDQLENKSSGVDQRRQAKYAYQYFKALDLMPVGLKQALDTFLVEMEQNYPRRNLSDFLSAMPAFSRLVTDPERKKEAEFYKEKIQPQFRQFLRDYVDGDRIVYLLAFQGEAQREMNVVIDEVLQGLSVADKRMFHKEALQEFFVNEMEEKAAVDYLFTPLQLKNLAERREEIKQVEKGRTILLDAIKIYQQAKMRIQKQPKKAEVSKKQEVADLTHLLMAEFDKISTKHGHPLAILANIKFKPFRAELDALLWQHALQSIFNKSQLKEMSAETDVKARENGIKEYLEAKFIIQKSHMPNQIRQQLNVLIEQLESSISHAPIQELLKTTHSSSSKLGEALFGSEVLIDLQHRESTTGFKIQELYDLMALSRARLDFLDNRLPTKKDKEQLAAILERCSKNVELQKKLKSFDSEGFSADAILAYFPRFLHPIVKTFIGDEPKKMKLSAGIAAETVKFVLAYVSNTKDLAQKDAALKQMQAKAQQLLTKYQTDPSTIESTDKLTIQELGLLSRYALMEKKLGEFAKILDFDSQTRQLLNQAVSSKKVYKQIENLIRPSLTSHYPDGSLLAYVARKKSAWLNKPLPLEERLTAFIANGFTHGAKLYHQDDKVYVSHLLGDLNQEELSLYQLCISDIWELDLLPLVPATMASFLNQIYGEGWQITLNQKYGEIERQLHATGEERFGHLTNLSKRRMAAGFADYPSLFRLMGLGYFKGHKKDTEADFDKLHRRFFGQEPLKREQICSEFASKATLASILQLNKELSHSLSKRFPQFKGEAVLNQLQQKNVRVSSGVKNYLMGIRSLESRSLSQTSEKELIQILRDQHYPSREIDLIIRLAKEEILDLPYDKKERMKAIHPGRMVQLLVDKKCAKLKAPPKELQALISL